MPPEDFDERNARACIEAIAIAPAEEVEALVVPWVALAFPAQVCHAQEVSLQRVEDRGRQARILTLEHWQMTLRGVDKHERRCSSLLVSGLLQTL